MKKRRITDSLIFRGFLYCFLAAVFVELVFDFRPYWGHLFLVSALISLIGYKNRRLILPFFCFLALSIGFLKTDFELSKIKDRVEKDFSGIVYLSSSSVKEEDYQKLEACLVEEKNGGILVDCENKILIFENLDRVYNFGEILGVDCKLTNPENKYPKFDYIKFLAKDNIYQICKGAKTSKINQDRYEIKGFLGLKTNFYKILFQIKTGLENRIRKNFSYPESAYLSGLLLGGEDHLPQDVQENFRRTGTTHTVAVSGFNITILAGFFMWMGILAGFYRQRAFWLAVVGVVCFVLMIGSPSSAVRAGIMGVVLLWASHRGRLADSVQVILFTAGLMIFNSPLILIYDVGFQLSFLASLAIILIYKPLANKFKIENDFLGLKSIVLVTISAQAGVLGIILYNFGTFSPISIFANLAILPVIPWVMLFGFISIIFGFVFPFFSKFIVFPVEIILKLEIRIVEVFSKIPWASLEIPDIGVAGLVLYYAIFIYAVFIFKKYSKLDVN